MAFLSLSFLSPFILLGLLALPVIWWLLRLTPPRPRQEVFPPTRILSEIQKEEESPSKSPWWLTLLRLLMAALIVFALAEPVWNKQDYKLAGSGPVLVLLDDGWTSGTDWDARKASASEVIKVAASQDRIVSLGLMSQGASIDLAPVRAEQIEVKLSAAEPKPIRVDHAKIAARLGDANLPGFGSVVWLSSGLDGEGTKALTDAIAKLGVNEVSYFGPEPLQHLALTGAANTPGFMQVNIKRSNGSLGQTGRLSGFDSKGRSVADAPFEFAAGKQETNVRFTVPVELRNEIVRVSISGGETAAATQLLDERFKRRRVGLLASNLSDDVQQPLLSPLYFLSRALKPFSEIREYDGSNMQTSITQLIDEGTSAIVLADVGVLPDEAQESLEKWIGLGGMLIRFAGPRLAGAENDTLVPVELRRGGRSLGGTLTWGTPQPVAKFGVESPFNGIPLPKDVTVSRQILAEPDVDLASKTWASLADGTPLVTASRRGNGWIVLFHVTADTGWSNLPLSGTFVDMLRRIVAVSSGSLAADRTRLTSADGSASKTEETVLQPLKALNGFGQLLPPASDVTPLVLRDGTVLEPSLTNPPGLYGENDAFIAINLFDSTDKLDLFDKASLPPGTVQNGYSKDNSTVLKPWLLAALLMLMTLDCLVVLWMSGALRRTKRFASASTALLLGFILLAGAPDTYAQEVDFEKTFRTRLAYVITGDQRVDTLSRKGLTGLTQFISARTSLEPADPVGVDLEKDELAFYPLLYWPISTSSEMPSALAMRRLDTFMKQGGSVLFDTRDQLSGGFGTARVTPETQRLREMLSAIDVPALEPVPERHVLTRTFFLLDVFPGRYLQGRFWVAATNAEEEDDKRPAQVGDGVSPIMITSNDMAGAWAVESSGAPTLPIVPPNQTQRLYAFRAGVNIVMYTLTGNYKSDQVHIPDLLERLGQ